MYLCAVEGGYKLTEIAERFGLSHYGGVGSAISVVRKSREVDTKVERTINSIVKRFDP